MGKLPANGRIPVRNVPGAGLPFPEVKDLEITPGETYHLLAIARVEENLKAIARAMVNQTKRVDEMANQSVEDVSLLESQPIEALPTYDTCAELIQAVLVTGPPSTAFVLNIGPREWACVTDVTGKWSVNGMGFLLSRADRRLLTPSASGNWTLELTGYADTRF